MTTTEQKTERLRMIRRSAIPDMYTQQAVALMAWAVAAECVPAADTPAADMDYRDHLLDGSPCSQAYALGMRDAVDLVKGATPRPADVPMVDPDGTGWHVKEADHEAAIQGLQTRLDEAQTEVKRLTDRAGLALTCLQDGDPSGASVTLYHALGLSLDAAMGKPFDHPAAAMNTQAIELAVQHGGTNEAHHLAWVVDQMVRALAGEEYPKVVAEACAGDDGPHTHEWDEGCAP